MNPDTNRFEKLFSEDIAERSTDEAISILKEALENSKIYREDGSEVPKHWSIFSVGEKVVIKNYTFEVKYIGETAILFEPVSPVIKCQGGDYGKD